MLDINNSQSGPDQKPPRESYNYFSTPDGEDVAQKLWYVLQPTTAAALALSTIDVMLRTKPKGYGNILARYASISLPIIGCASAFVLTSNALGSLRNKQDRLNWFIGGMASGGVIGAWTKKQHVGWTSALALGAVAYLKKYAVDNNVVLFPQNRPHYSIRSGQYDYTLTKNYPGNYTTGPLK